MLEQRIMIAEFKADLTETNSQCASRMKKMITDVTKKFKTYNFILADQIEQEKVTRRVKGNELKVTHLIDLIRKIFAIPSPVQDKENDIRRKHMDQVE